MKKFFALAIAAIICTAVSAQRFPFENTALSPEERAEDLISRLTLEEKANLLLNASVAVPRLGKRLIR